MNLPRFTWFFAAAALSLLTGCCWESHDQVTRTHDWDAHLHNWGFRTRYLDNHSHYCGDHSRYTELLVTNPRGELIADWIARGYIAHTEAGYRITAMERTEGYPHPLTVRYPDGWRVTVVGPNVHRWPCARPAWLDSY